MKYTIERHERYVVIEPLTPRLDGEAATKLKVEFMLRNTGGQRNIVLDLSQVEEIDEAGVRMGLLARRLCRSVGGLFIIVGVRPEVANDLNFSALYEYFIIAEDLENAKDKIFGNEIRLDLRGEV